MTRMNRQFVVGIDYSMTSPSVCVHPTDIDFSFESCVFYNITSVKNLIPSQQITFETLPVYLTDAERFETLSNKIIEFLSKFRIALVLIEGYSMGSKGMVFNIAENTGILKNKMYRSDIPLATMSPTSIKKCATGKGNAKKDQMEEAFHQLTKCDIKSTIGQSEKTENPSSDLIDSFFICKIAHDIQKTKSQQFVLKNEKSSYFYKINRFENNLVSVEKNIDGNKECMYIDELTFEKNFKILLKQNWKQYDAS